MKLKALAAIFAGATLLASASPLMAETAEEKAHDAREGYMYILSMNVGTLAAMAKGEAEYDAAKAKTAADNLALLGKVDISNLWMPGTDTSMEGSRALPALFENLGDVQAKQMAFAEAASALAATADQGLDAVKAGIGPVGQSCGACHKMYRAEE